jgi:hypothetical protein
VPEKKGLKEVAERVGFEHFGRSMRISVLPILQGISSPDSPLESPYSPLNLPPALFPQVRSSSGREHADIPKLPDALGNGFNSVPHLIRHCILANDAERPLTVQSHQKYHQSLSISTAANALKV